jgi:hypothetical protein
VCHGGSTSAAVLNDASTATQFEVAALGIILTNSKANFTVLNILTDTTAPHQVANRLGKDGVALELSVQLSLYFRAVYRHILLRVNGLLQSLNDFKINL